MIISMLGVVLAGGQATRMEGKAKGLMSFKGELLCLYPLKALEAVCDDIVVNANQHVAEYEKIAHVLRDHAHFNHCGPLSGVYTALKYASDKGFTHLIISPCDTPYVGQNAFEKLKKTAELSSGKIVCIESKSGIQPLHAVIPVSGMHLELENFLNEGGRRVTDFYKEQGWVTIFLKNDVFSNINYLNQLL